MVLTLHQPSPLPSTSSTRSCCLPAAAGCSAAPPSRLAPPPPPPPPPLPDLHTCIRTSFPSSLASPCSRLSVSAPRLNDVRPLQVEEFFSEPNFPVEHGMPIADHMLQVVSDPTTLARALAMTERSSKANVLSPLQNGGMDEVSVSVSVSLCLSVCLCLCV